MTRSYATLKFLWHWLQVTDKSAFYNLIHYHFFRPYFCLNGLIWGAWIAEWSSHSTLEHQYAMPWAVSSSLGDVKLFFGPKHNIYALFMILIDLFDLILLFVCQICHVNYEAENWKLKKFFFFFKKKIGLI